MEFTNHLIQESSPYLLQHAHNPVDWYPWNKAALAKAREENKPILLSIGYAACHWCHVMAHESFEDNETAQLMNQLFINIKVDREERPDLDKVYQAAHYLLTQQSGGWPLTLVLTPEDQVPFFSGTYFPLTPRYQLPSFKEVLTTLANVYQNHLAEIKEQNRRFLTIIHQDPIITQTVTLTDEPLKQLLQYLPQKFDSEHGGFGKAPKFPQPMLLELLTKEKSAMALTTLQQMANGGIYDQLQGGFFRYSVDEKWQIPHFEKMLYDNAQLLLIYTRAYQQFSEENFATITRETADWLLSVMQSPEGGFYASIDADSEGHEGKMYIWNKFEIAELLTEKEMDFANVYFGLNQPPNFEKHWHLTVTKPLSIVMEQLSLSDREAQQLLINIKQKLLHVRSQRINPACDTKILTSWNALTIKGLAVAGNILQKPEYIKAAENTLHFIQEKLWVSPGSSLQQKFPLPLLASYKEGKSYLLAYLDDYAYLLDAVLTLYSFNQDPQKLSFAVELADNLLDHFYDKKNGGFFFISDKHESLLYRPKTMLDEAIPSGNGVAVRCLIKLGRLLNQERYLQAAEKTLQNAWPMLKQFPTEHCSLLLGLEDWLQSPYQDNS